MQPDMRKKIDEILGAMYCPHDYSCAEPNVEHYETDGPVKFVVCLRSDFASCPLATQRAGTHECRCVLRATLLDKLH